MKRRHVVIATALVVISAVVGYSQLQPTQTKSVPVVQPLPQPAPVSVGRVGPADIYPHSETPGVTNPDVTQDNINQNICNPSWSTKSIRPPATYTTSLKVKQLANGYALNGDTNTADYEEDHLISLELGGNPTDPGNLWPEPYNASIPDGGAKKKDLVENYLHKQVCSGSLTLAEAQSEITSDWYAVYLKMNGQ